MEAIKYFNENCMFEAEKQLEYIKSDKLIELYSVLKMRDISDNALVDAIDFLSVMILENRNPLFERLDLNQVISRLSEIMNRSTSKKIQFVITRFLTLQNMSSTLVDHILCQHSIVKNLLYLNQDDPSKLFSMKIQLLLKLNLNFLQHKSLDVTKYLSEFKNFLLSNICSEHVESIFRLVFNLLRRHVENDTSLEDMVNKNLFNTIFDITKLSINFKSRLLGYMIYSLLLFSCGRNSEINSKFDTIKVFMTISSSLDSSDCQDLTSDICYCLIHILKVIKKDSTSTDLILSFYQKLCSMLTNALSLNVEDCLEESLLTHMIDLIRVVDTIYTVELLQSYSQNFEKCLDKLLTIAPKYPELANTVLKCCETITQKCVSFIKITDTERITNSILSYFNTTCPLISSNSSEHLTRIFYVVKSLHLLSLNSTYSLMKVLHNQVYLRYVFESFFFATDSVVFQLLTAHVNKLVTSIDFNNTTPCSSIFPFESRINLLNEPLERFEAIVNVALYIWDAVPLTPIPDNQLKIDEIQFKGAIDVIKTSDRMERDDDSENIEIYCRNVIDALKSLPWLVPTDNFYEIYREMLHSVDSHLLPGNYKSVTHACYDEFMAGVLLCCRLVSSALNKYTSLSIYSPAVISERTNTNQTCSLENSSERRSESSSSRHHVQSSIINDQSSQTSSPVDISSSENSSDISRYILFIKEYDLHIYESQHPKSFWL